MNVVEITVNGQIIEVDEPTGSLLDTLRYQMGLTSVKDGCSPQGQCGCCTVLVDGQARVSCVTPVRRVRGRSVVTLEGLEPDCRSDWANRFTATGASQCGFCTPGIIMRLEALRAAQGPDEAAPGDMTQSDVEQALLAHLCRCTGWQTIVEAACGATTQELAEVPVRLTALTPDQAGSGDAPAGTRATLEGRAPQRVDTDVPAGLGGFAADGAPADCLVAVSDDDGTWVVGETLHQARQQAGKVQGRRTTVAPSWPIDVPPGMWAACLQTTWVDGAYLETDASWCAPGGDPHPVEANGGAFGAKWSTAVDGDQPPQLQVAAAARRLADEHDRPVLALANREDVTRYGRKRPPVAAAVSADGTGQMVVARTPGITEAVSAGLAANPDLVNGATLDVVEVDVAGPPTSSLVRAAGWAEALVLLSALRPPDSGPTVSVRSPDGAAASASVQVADDGRVGLVVSVECGPVLDAVVLRSYCVGAAHMAWSWLTSESLAVDDEGRVHDLTVRSFGVLRAIDTPSISVELIDGPGEPVNGCDAVFAAVAAAGWRACGYRERWPVGDVSPVGG